MTRTFTFPETVTIQNVEAVADDVKKLSLQSGETLTLDAGNTAAITTPGIQLTLSLAAALEQNGGKLVIANPKQEFKQSFEALGLAQKFSQWEATHG